MAKRRRNRSKESSIIAVAINSDWWFSAIVSSGIFALALYILPAIASQNTILRALSGTFKPILFMFGCFFALIAVFNFFRQTRSVGSSTSQNTSPIIRSDHPAQESHASAGSEHKVVHGWSKNSTQPGYSGLQRSPIGEGNAKHPTSWSIELLKSIEWKLFEDLSAAYYKEKGIRAELTRLGADGGIDIKLFQDNSGNPTSIVQCKAWNSRQVGVKEIREFLGVMSHEKIRKGFFMASGSYSDDAKEIAKANQITLIDGAMLLAMIQRLPNEAQNRLLALATAGDYTTPSCPSCGVKMLIRTGKRGEFWGCKNFPRCRQMLHVKSSMGNEVKPTSRGV